MDIFEKAIRDIAHKRRCQHQRVAKRLAPSVEDAQINLWINTHLSISEFSRMYFEVNPMTLFHKVSILLAVRRELAKVDDDAGVLQVSAGIHKVIAREKASQKLAIAAE